MQLDAKITRLVFRLILSRLKLLLINKTYGGNFTDRIAELESGIEVLMKDIETVLDKECN